MSFPRESAESINGATALPPTPPEILALLRRMEDIKADVRMTRRFGDDISDRIQDVMDDIKLALVLSRPPRRDRVRLGEQLRSLRLVVSPYLDEEEEEEEEDSDDECECKDRGAYESAIGELDMLDNFAKNCSLEGTGGGGGRVVTRLECKHLFHESSLVSWFRILNACPLCRFRVRD